MNNSPLKNARLTIELDTQDAQARLDKLEERIEELTDDIDDQGDQVSDHEKRTSSIGRQNREREAKQKPSMENTGPGKFGIRNIPAIMTGAEMAGFVGQTTLGWIPGFSGVGQAARKAFDLEQQYGPFASGMKEAIFGKSGMTQDTKHKSEDFLDIMHKTLADFDKRLKAVTPTLESVIEMSKAQLLAGGTIDPQALGKFALTSFEWNFVQQRKDQDIRDKTLRLLGEKAPNVIKELFSRAIDGKLVP